MPATWGAPVTALGARRILLTRGDLAGRDVGPEADVSGGLSPLAELEGGVGFDLNHESRINQRDQHPLLGPCT